MSYFRKKNKDKIKIKKEKKVGCTCKVVLLINPIYCCFTVLFSVVIAIVIA